jgi:hypothetical protein
MLFWLKKGMFSSLNPFVAGSIPARPTSNSKACSDAGLFTFAWGLAGVNFQWIS